MVFRGWPVEAIEFFEGLTADNTKMYWQEHKEIYEQCVRAPMEALLAELEPEFGAGKIFRPYRGRPVQSRQVAVQDPDRGDARRRRLPPPVG